MSIARQLRNRKSALGKTLAEISRLTGMSAPHLSNILNGRKDARASTLDAVADALDAEWVLVPRHLQPEVARLLSGKTIAPDDLPSTVDRLFGGAQNE
jgi:transcriptional regulator with XRE-family HTH domain